MTIPAMLFCAASFDWKDPQQGGAGLASLTAGRSFDRPANARNYRIDHPLAPILELAEQTHGHVQQNVESYACRLIKRERIGDELQEPRCIEMRVRERISDGESTIQPLSVFLDFQAPRAVAGRKVLYVEDQSDGEMLVRKGGGRLRYIVISVDPRGITAQRESCVPVCELGFFQLVGGMLAILHQHRDADPTGENTVVQSFREREKFERPCQVVKIAHPEPQEGLLFHQAVVYLDQELGVPIHIKAYDWPVSEGQQPPLLGEYTYQDLQLNVDLHDDQFDPAVVRGK